LVVHLLERGRGAVAAIDDLVDPVAALLGAPDELLASIRSMSTSSKNSIRRTVSRASSAVRTSVTSWYIWSGMSQSFWKTRALGTFL
jgi:uncharacterized protein YoxC